MPLPNYPTEAPRYEDAINPQNVRSVPSTDPYLTPYLGLRARLSQVWFNRWTVLLLLVLVRVLLATQSLDSDLESARRESLSACTAVESMGSAMASMPYYMSQGVNEMAAEGIETAVRALDQTLLLLITAVQEIVVFVINMITSTYVCLFTLAVGGSLGAALNATEKIADFINGTLDTIFDDISDDAKTIQDALNTAADAVAAIPNFFGADVRFPEITLPSLDKLKNVSIPSQLDTKLQEIRDNIPTFDEVKEAADNAIRTPFQAIQNLVNQSLTVYTFDRSVFPVPEKEKLTFCSDNPSINNFFDNLVNTIHKVRNILIGVIVALAVLAMIPMGYREWWNWRSTRNRAYMITAPGRRFDPIDIVTIASRPFSSTIGLKFANAFKSTRRQILVRWAVAYVTSTPALFLLSLGIAGLFSVLAQFILLKQVEVAAPGLAAEVGEFAGLIVDQLEAVSVSWAQRTNEVINSTNAELNEELFGWVKTGTDSLNDTLNTFVDTMYDSVDATFGDTILSDAIKDVLNCLITIKVKGIQKGLTWAHDNAQVTFPSVPNDLFSLGASNSISEDASSSSSFLSDTNSVATDKITDVVVKLTAKWASMLREEAIISSGIIAIWVLVLIIAVVRTLVMFRGTDKVRGDGGDMVISGPLDGNPFDDRHRVNTGYGYSVSVNAGRDRFPRFERAVSVVSGGEHVPSPDYSEKDEGWVNIGLVEGKNGVVHQSGEGCRDSVYPSVYEKN